ncbi:hypothetical protein D3C86_966150 [compost metagenome]
MILASAEEAFSIAVCPGLTVVAEAWTCGKFGSELTVTTATVRLELEQLPFAAST